MMTKVYNYYENDNLIVTGTIKQIANKLNFSNTTIYKQIARPTKGRKMVEIGKEKRVNKKTNNKIYALYKGDTFIDVGTLEEIAERQGMKLRSIYSLKSPSKLARLEKEGSNVKMLIEVED